MFVNARIRCPNALGSICSRVLISDLGDDGSVNAGCLELFRVRPERPRDRDSGWLLHLHLTERRRKRRSLVLCESHKLSSV